MKIEESLVHSELHGGPVAWCCMVGLHGGPAAWCCMVGLHGGPETWCYMFTLVLLSSSTVLSWTNRHY